MGAIAAMALPPQIAVPVDIRNEILCFTRSNLSQSPTQEQGDTDAARGIDETGAAGFKYLLQIHAESQAHHGCLQQ